MAIGHAEIARGDAIAEKARRVNPEVANHIRAEHEAQLMRDPFALLKALELVNGEGKVIVQVANGNGEITPCESFQATYLAGAGVAIIRVGSEDSLVAMVENQGAIGATLRGIVPFKWEPPKSDFTVIGLGPDKETIHAQIKAVTEAGARAEFIELGKRVHGGIIPWIVTVVPLFIPVDRNSTDLMAAIAGIEAAERIAEGDGKPS